MFTSRSNQITVRLAKTQDIEEVVELINTVYAECDEKAGSTISYRKKGEAGNRTNYSAILEKITSPSEGLYVAVDSQGKIIGTQCISLQYAEEKSTNEEINPKGSELTLFAIHRDYRGKGTKFGAMFSDCVEADLKKIAAPSIDAEVVLEQNALINYYKSHGFFTTGKQSPLKDDRFIREIVLVQMRKYLTLSTGT